jgi:type II secretory pathway pseudopilin PulG
VVLNDISKPIQGIKLVKTGMVNSMEGGGRRHLDAFTLIEMIGVLSVITILAALLLPKVANAISDAKINSTAGSYQSVLTACVSHYGKYLAYNALFGTQMVNVPIVGYDTNVLLPEGFLDHSFTAKVGGPNAVVQLVAASACDSGQGYYFNGVSNGVASTANFQYVIECVLTNVQEADAIGVSLAIDGPTMTPALDGLVDTAGKVTFNPTLNGGTMRMYVDGR